MTLGSGAEMIVQFFRKFKTFTSGSPGCWTSVTKSEQGSPDSKSAGIKSEDILTSASLPLKKQKNKNLCPLTLWKFKCESV